MFAVLKNVNHFNLKHFSDGGLLLPTLLRPKSRGFVQLRTNNPFDPPVIEPNYLQHPDDIKTFVAGMKLGLKLTETQAFKERNMFVVVEKHHCGSFKPFTDGYLKCIIQNWSTTVYHQSGTCKMGPSTDPLAVVDSQLRVRGFKNLRVIDASVMPTIVGGNTNGPTIMIGEKGADMIIQSWTGTKNKESFKKEEL